ncbi:MAG TPA: hypothetical protein VG867_06555 [Rhizomicrobium sp.]|nr:hypothetical protein [Rhizomicrobium sp.]
MKHATPAALDRLETLLRQLRKIPGLVEKSRGVFYRGGHAFLHFHEDGKAFFADIRLAEDFERFPATTRAEQAVLLRKLGAIATAPKKNANRTG